MKEHQESTYKSPDALKKELLERAKYYAKGFGAELVGVKGAVESYLMGREHWKKYIEDSARNISELYNAVSREELVNHPDGDILSVIKDRVEEFVREAEEILKGKKNSEKLDALVSEIDELGSEYRRRLKTLLSALRTYPGYEKYGLASEDIDGKLWRSII